jgi:hypothetical protein
VRFFIPFWEGVLRGTGTSTSTSTGMGMGEDTETETETAERLDHHKYKWLADVLARLKPLYG